MTEKYSYYKNDPEWREKHKERMREKIDCESCGCKVQRYAMKRHERTTKHKLKSQKGNLLKEFSPEELSKLRELLKN